MSFILTSILPDFFWRKTNNAHNPVGGIAPPPWDAHLKLSFMDEAGIDVAVTSIPTPGVHVGDDGRSSIVARDSFATRNFTVQRAFMVVAVIASSIAILFAPALAQSQDRSVMTTDALGRQRSPSHDRRLSQERSDGSRSVFCGIIHTA
jgi:hypothetical protein